jgi:hypothetical protein
VVLRWLHCVCAIVVECAGDGGGDGGGGSAFVVLWFMCTGSCDSFVVILLSWVGCCGVLSSLGGGVLVAVCWCAPDLTCSD